MNNGTTASTKSLGLPARAATLWRNSGKVERACALILLLWLSVFLAAPNHFMQWVLRLVLIFFAGWTFLRWFRGAMKQAIWSLRNRLVVAYLFMAAVPVILILLLAMVSANILADHLAVHIANVELDRRVESLRDGANAVMRFPAASRIEPARRLGDFLADRFPGFQMILSGQTQFIHPAEGDAAPPPIGWNEVSGVVVKDKALYLWAHVAKDDGDITLTVPVTRTFLAALAPQLGKLGIADLLGQLEGKGITAKVQEAAAGDETAEAPPADISPKTNILDQDVRFAIPIPLAIWDQPGRMEAIELVVSTRMSALVNLILSRKGEVQDQTRTITFAFYLLVVLFVVVELFALFIGISITRSMTAAVHDLYEGTLRVRQEDFAHRIQVRGGDQVAGLSESFNSMTAKIERLLVVAKEKERLQTEVEIAREVQTQLFPRESPGIAGFEITAVCNAARSVSGDYYDFRQLDEHRIAVAMGDVAGKGISAALLMATLASSLRTQLGYCMESDGEVVSTSKLVSNLNQHIYAHTSPEKYATFCLGVYDRQCGDLTYTNGGHLPPILIRKGEASMFDVNGIVVGAFPFAQYGESRLQLELGDLLLFYTDGITEPENEYGEMFGEERLIELLIRHADRSNAEIIQHILDAVNAWTYDKDSMDDMTLLIARRT
jgi:sigma-B regulation protein RsbU (phosphoserine phosphatase)